MRDSVAILRQIAASAGGCPAVAPSVRALGMGWRLRADALHLAAAHAASSSDPSVREQSRRLRRLAQTWAAGASRLDRGWEPTVRQLGWLAGFLERSAALPGVGAAWAVMAAELAVWRLARSVRP